MMRISTMSNGAVAEREISKIVRVPAALSGQMTAKAFTVSKVTVTFGPAGGQDRIEVESEGAPAGVLLVRAGLGNAVGRWLLSDARVTGVEGEGS